MLSRWQRACETEFGDVVGQAGCARMVGWERPLAPGGRVGGALAARRRPVRRHPACIICGGKVASTARQLLKSARPHPPHRSAP